ncbi:prepilin peptidase CpaA [Desulfonatronum thiosulfatophilum]|uniref:Prepilin peptidase CpaA n=2 Tax=Desulfonatronum thiosulfatophilum TaxID=617002 RepID=A0A1G6C892_9BACT|nr:prepilin peptidase CpaA [Desulfonatronum thiosulfatophilum]
MIEFFVLAIALISASIYDVKYKKIPNILNLSLIIFAVFYNISATGFEGLLFSGVGLTVGICMLLPVYTLGGMGAGDVKLMGAVGSMIGAKGVLISAIYTGLYGGLYALLILLIHRQYGRVLISRTWAVLKTFLLTRQYVPVDAPHPIKKKPKLCYGVAIALGTTTYLLHNHLGYTLWGS